MIGPSMPRLHRQHHAPQQRLRLLAHAHDADPHPGLLTPPKQQKSTTYQMGTVFKANRISIDADAYRVRFQNSYSSLIDPTTSETSTICNPAPSPRASNSRPPRSSRKASTSTSMQLRPTLSTKAS
jgi:hypothetical protein